MKFIKYLICIFMLSLLVTACSLQNIAVDTGSAGSDEPQLQAESCMPMHFDSEEQLLNTINQVKNVNSKTETKDDVVLISSDMTGEQTYSAKRDMFKLVSVTEFYKPVNIPKGISFKEILVKNEYISYWYVNEDKIDCATFTWFREMPPEVHMNELSGRGAIAEREIENNGIKYVLLEWTDSKTGKSSGFSIDWVSDGKPYSACVPAGYTDDEMLAFCQFEVVTVK
ncbi:MAG: hypothetical protein WDA65_06675 [Christensenellales bacterium]